MFRPTIRRKLLVLLLAVSLVPLALVSVYWYRTTQNNLRSDAESQQQLLAQSDTYRVNQYMTDKVNALIIHSQATSVQALYVPAATKDLTALIQQDSDIEQLSLANQSGKVVVNLDRKGNLPTGANVSTDDAFRATTYLAGKEYISPVHYNSQGQPIVTIAAPLIQYTSGQQLASLSTADASQIRSASEIYGVLTETVNLNSLWRTVLAHSNGMEGYAYVVDSQGTLIGYPDTTFQASHKDLSHAAPVAAFLASPAAGAHPATMTSERGIKVLSSYGQVTRTGWGVITEVPLTTVFANANQVARLGAFIVLLAAVLVVALSYFVSRRVATPIKALASGAARISAGQLDTRVTVQSNDELGILSRSFNQMAANLASTLQQVVAESTRANVILNNVAEGILALDGEGRVVLANSSVAGMIDDSAANIVGKPLSALYQWTANAKTFEPSLSEVGAYQEVVLTSLNKRVHYVDVLINPIRDDPTGIRSIVTILDRSKERELENMKVDFVSMAAHELRTPMTSIRGYVDLIQREADFTPPDSIRDYIDHIESSSVQLVGLINNLLNVSRIERGTLTLRRDKVDWAEIVQKSIVDQQFAAKAKSIELTYEGPERGVYIFADGLAMSEVINNLLSNAINHSLSDGHVTVRIEMTSQGVKTTVVDDGVGIPRESLPYLFTKFYRARRSLTSGSGGTGLGLYISRSIAELHDGSISVDSDEGKGATFTVELPPFDEEKYNEHNKLRVGNITQNHGWIIKNTARRR